VAILSGRQDVEQLNRQLEDKKLELQAAKEELAAARQHTEESLREAGHRYRSLFEGMLHGFAHCEMLYENGAPRDFVYLDVNKAFEELTGLTGVVGKRVSEVIPGIRESSPELFERYGRVASTGIPEKFEFYLPALGIWISISLFSPEKDHFIALFDNISERRRTEEALRFQNLLLATLSEVSIDGILVVDSRGQIIHFNRRFVEMWGIPPHLATAGDDGPVLQTVVEKVTTPDEFLARVRHLYEHPEETGHEEIALKDGRTFERYSAPLLGAERDSYGRVWYFRDVSGRKREQETLEQLRQSQKMEAVGQLAGGIAHDFNNLLTTILGYSDLLASRTGDDDLTRKELEEIRRAGERAASLTRQLLAFSRKQILEPRVLNLNRVVRNIEQMLRRLIGEDVELETRLPESVGAVRADPGQIEQVIMNLILNARDAMPTGGKLTIETADVELETSIAAFRFDLPAGRYVLLAVSDTGTGMDARTLSHIFEPFFTTKEQGKGTGLGLATAYGIVRQSGGYITVDSEAGRGTTFRIYLPRVEGVTEISGRTPSSSLSPIGTETILLVEDEAGVRKLSLTVLEKKGYVVLEAASGDMALQVARSQIGPIHLVLTDVVMPGMSGRELWDRLRLLRPDSRVLFMSGYMDDAIARHGVLESGIAFLQKPFTPFGLAQKVRDVLDAPAKADA
jgi:two-component system, cell cycle sensor histidine kinase and response regulator CckA